MEKNVQVFYKPGNEFLEDYITKDGLTSVEKMTPNQFQAENPDCVLIDYDDFKARVTEIEDREMLEPWVEITAEDYNDSLNVLPPEKWETCRGCEVFRLCEYYYSNITTHFIKRGDRYFKALRRISQRYFDLVQEVWNL